MKRVFSTTLLYCLFVPGFVVAIVFAPSAFTKTRPVVSDIQMIGGERGVVALLRTTGFYNDTVTVNDKKISVILDDCDYGLPETYYENFPEFSPVEKIEVNRDHSAAVEIILSMKDETIPSLKIIRKSDRWAALISTKVSKPFTWSASSGISGEVGSETVRLDDVMGTAPHLLKNIRLIERGQICVLVFEFDGPVGGVAKRQGDVLILTVNNSRNATGTTSPVLPERSLFRELTIDTVTDSSNRILTITSVIAPAEIEPGVSASFNEGNTIAFYLVKRNGNGAMLWTTKGGLEVDHGFYDVPSYKPDFDQMSDRARIDALVKISRRRVFPVVYEHDTVKDSETFVGENTDSTNSAPPSMSDTIALAYEKNEDERRVAVTTCDVNMRGYPSMRGRFRRVISKGTDVGILEEKKGWSKVVAGTDTGFVSSALLQKTNATEDTSGVNRIISGIRAMQDDAFTDRGALEGILDTVTDIPVVRKKVVAYRGAGRDPFMPLLLDSALDARFPDVHDLNLVGVLVDDFDRIALCEDRKNDNRPFTFREHDSVHKGKVLKIYRNKVVFLLTEYGVSRSVTLTLSDATTEREEGKK